MCSVRCKNGRYYYRVTLYENGKRRYIERGGFDTYEEAYETGNKLFPNKFIHLQRVSPHLAEIIFERFDSTTSGFLPLLLIYRTDATPKEIYESTLCDFDLKRKVWHLQNRDILLSESLVRAIRTQARRIDYCVTSLKFNVPDQVPLIINFKTGEPIKKSQMDYITKVIRTTINPYWTWKTFRASFEQSNDRAI